MKIENLKTFNFEGAFRGMRSPLESWDKSDSIFDIINSNDADDFYWEVASKWAEQEGKPNNDELIDKYITWLSKVGCLGYSKYNSHILEIALIGPKDLELAQRLIRAGGEHRKFLRQIFISFDLTAPLYWQAFCQ